MRSPHLELQPRDFAFLCGLFESRVMTLAHIAALYFDGKREMAKKRVGKLKATGLLAEYPRNFTAPSILYLTRDAIRVLDDNGRLAAYPHLGISALERRALVSHLTLRHELQVMDVKAALLTAIKSTPSFTVAQFSTWPALYEFHAVDSAGNPVTVQPDGYVRIVDVGSVSGLTEHAFFLEVDRGTETLQRVVDKCIGYRHYQRSGGYAQFQNKEGDVSISFRVLIVCQSETRRDHLAEALLAVHPPFATMIFITTRDHCLSDPLNVIWLTPGNYRKALGIEGRSAQTVRFQHSLVRASSPQNDPQLCRLFPNSILPSTSLPTAFPSQDFDLKRDMRAA